MNRRRRTLPPVPPKAPSELRPLIAAITEILETGEGVRGDPLDRKLTLRDILDSGIGKLKPGMRPGQDGNLDSGALPPAPDLSIPPAPSGFDAQGGFYGMINLSWTIPGQQYRNHAYTNIFRSEEDNFANAEVIGREAGGFYTDYVRDDAVDPNDPTKLKGYYYWITFTSVADIEGPPNSQNGTYAAPLADLGYVIELITGEIDDSVLAQSLQEEIARIGELDTALNGPESLDGTVANRLAQEREARIAALDSERLERIDGLTFEAQARAQAIQQEVENRTTAITQAVEQLELEDSLLALQQNVIAASYNANAASIYSMSQVRINDNEVFATQIDQLFGNVNDNEALILLEQQIRIDQFSSLSTQVGILSARLDARPSLASSFEAGSDFNAWSVTSNNTLAAETSDVYAGQQAARISSSQSSASPQTGGVRRAVDADTATEFAGNEVRFSFYAKRPSSNASSEFAVAYCVDGVFGEWVRLTPTNEYAFYDVLVAVPAGNTGAAHELVIWGDTSGTGKSVLVDRVLVTFAEVDIPEVTAAIEQIQQALVDQEQAVASELQAFLSQLNTNTASIQDESSTRSTQIDALATDLQTLTAQTQNNTADIVAEREAWSSAVDALALDVESLMASVGDDVVLVSEEARIRAAEDELLGSIQRVMSATRKTAAATFYGLEEVRTDDKQATARRIDGLEVELGDAFAAIEETQSILASETQALSSQVTTVASELGDNLAGVQQTFETEITRVDGELTSLGALYTVQVQANGLVGGFGVYNDGSQVDAGFDVDRFFVGRTNANKRRPFIIDNNVVYMNNAMIRNGSIQEGQLGAITIGKFFLNDGTPVTTAGGLIRAEAIDVDNLNVASAATFYGNAQSANFVAGSRGWRLLQNGNVEFNQGQFNGTVNVGNVSGLGSLATQNSLSYSSLTGTKPPTNADKTADNTAADTLSVAGIPASTVRDRANAGNNANSRVNNWTRPDSTLIDGNKIFTGDAYVDTLQIKGNAITIPSASFTEAGISLGTNWTTVQTLWVSRGNAPVHLTFGCSCRADEASSSVADASVSARLLIDGYEAAVYSTIVSDSARSFNNQTVIARARGLFSGGFLLGAFTGSSKVEIQLSRTGTSGGAFNRFIQALTVKR